MKDSVARISSTNDLGNQIVHTFLLEAGLAVLDDHEEVESRQK